MWHAPRNLLAVLVMGYALLATGPAEASVVIFTDVVITDESDILNTGTLIVARNYGGGYGVDAVDVDINGILFAGPTSLPAGWASSGDVGFSTEFGSSDLNTLLDTLIYGPIGGPPQPDKVISFSTVVGNTYRLQLLFDNDLNTTGDNQVVVLGESFASESPLDDAARVLRVEFTALSTTTDVTFKQGTPEGSLTQLVNAAALHQIPIPEPHSLAIWSVLSLIGVGVVARRRQRKPSA